MPGRVLFPDQGFQLIELVLDVLRGQHHNPNIYLIYITFSMKHIPVKETTRLTVDGVEAFFEKTVTAFGTGAKIDCPRQYLGRNVYVVIRRQKNE